jgi:alanine racemase
MDMTLLDVTRVPNPRRGNEVVWLGQSGRLTRTATDLALEADTIPWEIFTRINPSLPRFSA